MNLDTLREILTGLLGDLPVMTVSHDENEKRLVTGIWLTGDEVTLVLGKKRG